MSATTFASPPAGALSNRSSSLFNDMATRFAMWRKYRRSLIELSSLSTRELEDLGMSRSSMQSVAYQAVYGDQDQH